MTRPATNAVLIVAAGRGSRVGGVVPKQFALLGGMTVLARTVRAFADAPALGPIQVVIHPDDEALYFRALRDVAARLPKPAYGGDTRQCSVLSGLEALAAQAPFRVLIHDAARPFVDRSVIDRVLAAVAPGTGVIPTLAVSDTLVRCDTSGLVRDTVPREHLWRVQTPQGFIYSEILAAHRAAAAQGRLDFTDDAAVLRHAGLSVRGVEGSSRNMKITTAEDLAMAQSAIKAEEASSEYRTGTGFDVHRFADGDHVWLCGVKIAHTRRLDGHSDADVGLHALTDALLGAIGDGDIGQHFPPSDPRWRGASSELFLADAARRVRQRGGAIVNVDVTLLCEEPKIAPYREAMQEAIARTLAIGVRRVGIKATTTEGLGFTGRREGIAAQAVATVRLPVDP